MKKEKAAEAIRKAKEENYGGLMPTFNDLVDEGTG
jgi:hypothetical protein